MEARPKIVIEKSDFDNLLESLGWLALLLMWGVAIYGYFTLPAVIPTHFNGAGRVDAYGGKITILLLPLVGTFLFAGLSILSKYPQAYNYPALVTPDNALRLYTMGTRLIRSLKVSIMAIFLMIMVFTHLTAAGRADGLPWWFFPVTMALLVVPAGYYTYEMFQAK